METGRIPLIVIDYDPITGERLPEKIMYGSAEKLAILRRRAVVKAERWAKFKGFIAAGIPYESITPEMMEA